MKYSVNELQNIVFLITFSYLKCFISFTRYLFQILVILGIFDIIVYLTFSQNIQISKFSPSLVSVKGLKHSYLYRMDTIKYKEYIDILTFICLCNKIVLIGMCLLGSHR